MNINELDYNDFKITKSEDIKLITDYNLKLYRFTFGSGQILEGYYIAIFAKNYDQARECMFKNYHNKWAFQYDEDSWNSNSSYCTEKYYKHIIYIKEVYEELGWKNREDIRRYV